MMRSSMVVLCGVLAVACRRDGSPVVTPATANACDSPEALRPWIVDWAAADRGALELRLRGGPVAVRYVGCALEFVDSCEVPGEYMYTGITRKHDVVVIRDVGELYAKIPLGALRFESKLARTGALHIDMTLVGSLAVDHGAYVRGDLRGPCERVTHVVTGAQVGVFSFYAGADVEVSASGGLREAGAGTRRTGGRELLNKDGEVAACAAATGTDAAAPTNCAALLRLEFSPVAAR